MQIVDFQKLANVRSVIDEMVIEISLVEDVSRPAAYARCAREFGLSPMLTFGNGWVSASLVNDDIPYAFTKKENEDFLEGYSNDNDIEEFCDHVLGRTYFAVAPEVAITAAIAHELDEECDLVMDSDVIHQLYPQNEWFRVATATPMYDFNIPDPETKLLFESDDEYRVRQVMYRTRTTMLRLALKPIVA